MISQLYIEYFTHLKCLELPSRIRHTKLQGSIAELRKVQSAEIRQRNTAPHIHHQTEPHFYLICL
jgi:hypothetical protein